MLLLVLLLNVANCVGDVVVDVVALVIIVDVCGCVVVVVVVGTAVVIDVLLLLSLLLL